MNVFFFFFINFNMKKSYLSLFLMIFCIFFLFVKIRFVQESILLACHLFFFSVFPSLFPMMILSDLLLYFSFPDMLSSLLGPLFSKFFHTSCQGCYILLMSFICGSPANAYTLKNLVLDSSISSEEAAHLMSFSFFPNPLFLYTMYSSYLHSSHLLLMMMIPYLSNIILGLLTRPRVQVPSSFCQKTHAEFGIYFSYSLRNTMNTLIFVLGSIVFFFILNSLINPCNSLLVRGLLEFSQGLLALTKSHSSILFKEILSLIFVSFGGLSIHLQVKGILSEAGISYLPFLKGRIYECLISITLFLLFHYAYF